VSSSRIAEKNQKLKTSSEPQNSKNPVPLNLNEPLINTSPVKVSPIETKKLVKVITQQDLMDSSVLGDPHQPKNEENSDFILQTTKQVILERVNTI
jgi:hypothetical protein